MLLLNTLCVYCLFTTAISLHSDLNHRNASGSNTRKITNSASICDNPSSSTAPNGELSSPNYPNEYPNNLNCVFYIYAKNWLYFIDLNIPTFHVEAHGSDYYYDWLTIEYKRENKWKTLVSQLDGQHSNLNYTVSNADIRLWFRTDDNNHQLYGASPYGFTLTWKSRFSLPIYPPQSASCAGPSILFLLDRSEAIFQNFYNADILNFIAKFTTHYAFVDDKTLQNPYHSRFGVIEFSDNATVSVPLDDYTRYDFISHLSKNVGYGNGGESNVSIALELAYAEFVRHGVPDNGQKASPPAIILVVNDISMFHFNKTLEAMEKLKTIVHLPMGIIVPGLSGTPVNAKKHLTTLLGNEKYAFDSLDDGIQFIPALTDSTFSCSVCTGIIFICETTAAISWDLKMSYLQLVQRLTANTERSSKQIYGIGLYGTQIYQHINMQPFDDFNQTLTALINNMNENNLPDGGQTFLTPILNELYTTLTTNLSTSHYATLIMGQVTAIKDPSTAYNAASKVATLSSDIYVVDQTHFSYPTIWHTITQDKPNHIINGSLISNPDDMFSTLQSTFLKDVNDMLC